MNLLEIIGLSTLLIIPFTYTSFCLKNNASLLWKHSLSILFSIFLFFGLTLMDSTPKYQDDMFYIGTPILLSIIFSIIHIRFRINEQI